MDHEHEAPVDREVELLLASGRPVPSTAWAAETGRRLLPVRASARVRWRPVLGTAGALGLVLFGATLAGGGPLGSNDDAARAKPGCDVVYVTRVEPVGEVRRQPDGSVRVETTRRPVPRAIERCR